MVLLLLFDQPCTGESKDVCNNADFVCLDRSDSFCCGPAVAVKLSIRNGRIMLDNYFPSYMELGVPRHNLVISGWSAESCVYLSHNCQQRLNAQSLDSLHTNNKIRQFWSSSTLSDLNFLYLWS